jgi:hypothetical protein
MRGRVGGAGGWGMPVWIAAVAALALAVGPPARAEVLPVPDAIRHLRVPQEAVHALRTRDGGVRLGEQRFHAAVDADRLHLTVTTTFTDGEHWDEVAVMDLADGYRARSFRKVGRRGGEVIADNRVDFASGEASWLAGGARHTRSLTLAPDAYTGPMLGVVLAPVAERPEGVGTIQVVVFRPDPAVYTLRAEVVAHEEFRLGGLDEPTTKVRLKADLGAVQNALFARVIPTHYFWFTRARPPEFFAFEGELGHQGRELLMIPERATSTARLGRLDGATR